LPVNNLCRPWGFPQGGANGRPLGAAAKPFHRVGESAEKRRTGTVPGKHGTQKEDAMLATVTTPSADTAVTPAQQVKPTRRQGERRERQAQDKRRKAEKPDEATSDAADPARGHVVDRTV
jgi:hypothetical protein